MTNKEIEKRLKKEIDGITPDVLDDILGNVKKTKQKEVNIMKKEKVNNEKIIKRSYIPKLVGVAACALFCIGGIFGFNLYQDNKVVSTIEFDVNPSIELRLDDDEEVIKAVALNEDGKKVLSDMNLKDADLDVAVNAIIGSMLKNGYLSEIKNSILVSVKNDDSNRATKLQEELSNEIDKILKANSIDGAILTQEYNDDKELKDQAKENDLSEGKTNLINNILKKEMKDHKGELYTFDDLANLSITELNLLLSSKNIELDNTSVAGSASEKGYITRDKAKEIAFDNAKVSSSNIRDLEVELDSENGKLVYEVEFDTEEKEYEYEIDAVSGEILHNRIENHDYDDRYDDDYDDIYDDDDDYDDDRYDD